MTTSTVRFGTSLLSSKLNLAGFWQAGRQFEQENEEKLKDQLGFGAATTARPASGPVGCRELVRENFSKVRRVVVTSH